MPASLAIVSDTHLPRGRRALPVDCLDRLRAADVIVHAGDFSAPGVYESICSLGRVVAVVGNADESALRRRLDERAVFSLEGVSFGVIHDAGPARGRLERMRSAFPQADAVIFGHSHIPLLEGGPDGFQIFNPGSPTDKRRQPRFTMGLASVSDGRVRFEIVPVG